MKIWGEIPRILGVYNKSKNAAKVEKTEKVAAKKDVISISNQAKDYQVAMKALKDVPDVRQDKIREIEEKYSGGTYNVNGRDIADKIVKSHLDKKV